MKTTLSLLILLFIAVNVSAQRVSTAQMNWYSQHNSFQQVSTITAYEESISQNFLFLVDDDIQRVIFNPARGFTISDAFVSNSIVSNSGRNGNDNIGVAGLIPAKKGQWFYSAGGRFISSEQFSDETDVNFSYTNSEFGSVTRNNISERAVSMQRTNEITNGQGELRLLKIIGKKEKAIAIGVFSGYSQYHKRRVTETEDTRLDIYEQFNSDTLTDRNTSNFYSINERYDKELGKQFVAGLEYFRWSNGNDSWHRIFIQKNLNDNTIDYRSNSYSLIERDDRIEENRFRERISRNDYAITDEVNPLQIRYNGYQNVKLNWLGSDYWFVEANAIYSFGESDKTIYNQRIRRDSSYNNFSESKDLYQNEFYDAEDRNYIGRISTGYAFTITEDDFTIFTGLNPFYEYSRLKTTTLNGPSRVVQDRFNHVAGIILPVYASFLISNKFTIWGGTNLRGDFNFNKNKERVYPDLEGENPLIYEVPLENKFREKDISINQRLFAGFRFTHKSGLSAVTNVRGNLSNIQGWFFTLRYSY